jgi:hypothetical protein
VQTLTVAKLIRAAFRRIGVIEETEALSAEAEEDGLDYLNDLIDTWKVERLLISELARTTWLIMPNQQDYSVGGARPTFIDHVAYEDLTTNPVEEYSLGDPLTRDQWMAIPQKTMRSTLPASAYYRPTMPTGTISLFPVPTATNLRGVLYAPNPVQEFTSTDQLIVLPPGYRRFLRENLAVELWPEWRTGESPDPVLVRNAGESKRLIKTFNVPQPSELDASYGSGLYDIESDTNSG